MSDRNSPKKNASLNYFLSFSCSQLNKLSKPTVNDHLGRYLRELPNIIGDSRPSHDQLEALEGFTHSYNEPTLGNLRICTKEYDRLLSQKVSKEPLFALIDLHKATVTAINMFEEKVREEPMSMFESSGTTTITGDRIHKHTGLKIVTVTQELRDKLIEWENEHQCPFEEYGVRYLDVLPDDSEVKDAEEEVRRHSKRMILH